jgi:hypothetical protein
MAANRDVRAEPETGDLSRREFLSQAVIAGAGVVGLTMVSAGVAQAAPEVQPIATNFTMVANLYDLKLNIASQTENSFTGSFDDGTLVSGTVTGNQGAPTTIVFNRVLSDGLVQTYTGAVSVRGDTDLVLFMAGVFFHDGVGPYPWSASGTKTG